MKLCNPSVIFRFSKHSLDRWKEKLHRPWNLVWMRSNCAIKSDDSVIFYQAMMQALSDNGWHLRNQFALVFCLFWLDYIGRDMIVSMTLNEWHAYRPDIGFVDKQTSYLLTTWKFFHESWLIIVKNSLRVDPLSVKRRSYAFLKELGKSADSWIFYEWNWRKVLYYNYGNQVYNSNAYAIFITSFTGLLSFAFRK